MHIQDLNVRFCNSWIDINSITFLPHAKLGFYVLLKPVDRLNLFLLLMVSKLGGAYCVECIIPQEKFKSLFIKGYLLQSSTIKTQLISLDSQRIRLLID